MSKRLAFYLTAILFVLVATAAYAQYGPPTTTPTPGPVAPPTTSGVERHTLQTTDFPNGYTTVQSYNIISPGATVARHTHPGIEVGYIIEGEGDFFVQGETTKHLKTGDSFVNPAGVPHYAKNSSADKPLKVLSIYVVEKGKPLATAAPM
jgi:quercetin dioxygenase-like cupin family protein